MKLIYADYTNFKVPLFCAYCAKKHPNLTRISLREAKLVHPDIKLLCKDCNVNLEVDVRLIPKIFPY